jgi:hypothetical protein
VPSIFDNHFCTTPKQKTCRVGRREKGTCMIYEHKKRLPRYQQYFRSRRKGGLFGHMEYCPTYEAVNLKGTFNGRCSRQATKGDWEGETFGIDSRCVDTYSDQQPDTTVPSCHRVKCLGDELWLLVGNHWHSCRNNEPYHTDGITVVCPEYSEVC